VGAVDGGTEKEEVEEEGKEEVEEEGRGKEVWDVDDAPTALLDVSTVVVVVFVSNKLGGSLALPRKLPPTRSASTTGSLMFSVMSTKPCVTPRSKSMTFPKPRVSKTKNL
jgi:hypothetical protein